MEKAGKLPPLAQRLPENPLVVQPVEQIGQYGGTWRRGLDVGYELLSAPRAEEAEYGFRLSGYHPRLLLVIDPFLAYAGFIGGSDDDQGNGIAIEGDGAAYVAGRSNAPATGFPDGDGFSPAPGLDQSHNGESDAFVVKISPGGTALVYATFVGGAGEEGG